MINAAIRRTGCRESPLVSCAMQSREATAAVAHALRDQELLVLHGAFLTAGGVVSGDELSYLVSERSSQPISLVARWIVNRDVVSYEWRGQIMLPLFQFDLPNATIRLAASSVIGELKSVFTDWELALWFAQPNAWLEGAVPLKMLGACPRALLDAARADRLIANG